MSRATVLDLIFLQAPVAPKVRAGPRGAMQMAIIVSCQNVIMLCQAALVPHLRINCGNICFKTFPGCFCVLFGRYGLATIAFLVLAQSLYMLQTSLPFNHGLTRLFSVVCCPATIIRALVCWLLSSLLCAPVVSPRKYFLLKLGRTDARCGSALL